MAWILLFPLTAGSSLPANCLKWAWWTHTRQTVMGVQITSVDAFLTTRHHLVVSTGALSSHWSACLRRS